MRKRLSPIIVLSSFILLALAVPTNTWAQAPDHKDKSQKLDFEDELVEGVNKKPLDSLSQISERERARRRLHLYKKKTHFKPETKDVLTELRYFQ